MAIEEKGYVEGTIYIGLYHRETEVRGKCYSQMGAEAERKRWGGGLTQIGKLEERECCEGGDTHTEVSHGAVAYGWWSGRVARRVERPASNRTSCCVRRTQ